MSQSAKTRIGIALSRFTSGWRECESPRRDLFFKPVNFLQCEGSPPLLALMVAIWLMRPDLQEAFEIEAPAGYREFLLWCFAHGLKEYRALRDALRRKEVSALYGLGSQSAAASPPVAGAVRAGGVNIIGHLFAYLGIGEDVRCAAAAFSAARVPHALIDAPAGADVSTGPHIFDAEVVNAPPYATNIFFMSGLETLRYFCEKGEDFWIGRWNLGVWPWELQDWPEALGFCLALVDEVWAISDFVRRGFELASLAPVVLMPPAVIVPPARFDRVSLGLPSDSFVFVTFFDGLSSYYRKNPEAAVLAFRNAFPATDRDVLLVIKAIRGQADLELWRRLLRHAQGDPRIKVIDEDWDRYRTTSLLARSDCLVSLHRSEGFGRSLAEAILLRKPLVATHWSGNLDFMNEGEQLLVESRLRKIEPGQYAWGEGQSWADPDLGAATMALREARCINYQATASAAFDPARVGARYRRRLEKIGALAPLA